MKNIIATTALVLMTTTSAMSQAQMAPFQEYTLSEDDMRASELIGMRLYATENEINEDQEIAPGTEGEWDDIGEINDIILNADGSVKTVIAGIGGFLGIGEKDIAVSMDQIRMVREQDAPDDFFLVVNTNKAMLEETPAFKRDSVDGKNNAMNSTETQTDTTGSTKITTDADNNTTTANNNAANDAGRPMLRSPVPPVREGYVEVAPAELTAERLTGARVYSVNDEDIGEIDELILTNDGQITEAVIDIGGFLGIGEHSVAVTFDELRVTRDQGWGDVRVYIDATKEELEAQPEYTQR